MRFYCWSKRNWHDDKRLLAIPVQYNADGQYYRRKDENNKHWQRDDFAWCEEVITMRVNQLCFTGQTTGAQYVSMANTGGTHILGLNQVLVEGFRLVHRRMLLP
jgi:hypothetical protein